MKKNLQKLLMLNMLILLSYHSQAQLIAQKIGNNPTSKDASAVLELESANKGLLPPRLTTVQRNAITLPAKGLVVFNLTSNGLEINTGTPAAPVWSSATTVLTANNGLTRVANDFRLGGTLTAATNIDQAGFNLSTTGTGNVGIGTLTPSQKLDVDGNAAFQGSITTINGFIPINGAIRLTPNLHLNSRPMSAVYANWDNGAEPGAPAIPAFVVGNGLGREAFRVNYNGAAFFSGTIDRINNQTPTHGAIRMDVINAYYNTMPGGMFYVNLDSGPGIATDAVFAVINGQSISNFAVRYNGNAETRGSMSASSYITISDSRLKTNVKPLTSSLSKLLQLEGKSYNWIDKSKSPETQMGYIAQEVEKIWPELVTTNESTGFKGINYIGLIAPITEAIKDLTVQNKAEQTEINALSKENQQLKSEIEKIKAFIKFDK